MCLLCEYLPHSCRSSPPCLSMQEQRATVNNSERGEDAEKTSSDDDGSSRCGAVGKTIGKHVTRRTPWTRREDKLLMQVRQLPMHDSIYLLNTRQLRTPHMSARKASST